MGSDFTSSPIKSLQYFLTFGQISENYANTFQSYKIINATCHRKSSEGKKNMARKQKREFAQDISEKSLWLTLLGLLVVLATICVCVFMDEMKACASSVNDDAQVEVVTIGTDDESAYIWHNGWQKNYERKHKTKESTPNQYTAWIEGILEGITTDSDAAAINDEDEDVTSLQDVLSQLFGDASAGQVTSDNSNNTDGNVGSDGFSAMQNAKENMEYLASLFTDNIDGNSVEIIG